MSSTSKYNPFGANSISSSWEDKMVYKYNVMKEYIKLTKRDALVKEYEQSRFLGVMVLGFVGGYFAAFALTTYIHIYLVCCREGGISRRITLLSGTLFSTELYQPQASATSTLKDRKGTTKQSAGISSTNTFP